MAQSGVASELVGFSSSSIDAEILRLENVLRDGLDPRIPNIKYWPVTLTSGVVLMIRIPRSWIPPHRVRHGGSSRFYARNCAGKYELDVAEMRPLFALSASTLEQVRNFRIQRLSKISSGEVSLYLSGEHRLVLHIVPFAAFDPSSQFDLSALKLETDRLRPIDVSERWHGAAT